MLVNFTNKCNKFVHITFVHINVTTYVVQINIKFMQKLEHAYCSLSSQINVISSSILKGVRVRIKRGYRDKQNLKRVR